MAVKRRLKRQVKACFTRAVPPRLLMQLKRVFYGGSERECCVCGAKLRRFLPIIRPGLDSNTRIGRCPVCQSRERERLAMLFLQRETSLFHDQGKLLLDIAPNPSMRANFERVESLRYVCGDLMRPGVDVQFDITVMPLADDSFDALYCSHVLEHVPGDRQAILEMARVIKPGGWALVMVPVSADRTHEDPEVRAPAERLRLYGQEDHVRAYGPDVLERWRSLCVEVEAIDYAAQLDDAERERYGVTSSDTIYLVHKLAVSTGRNNRGKI